MTDATSCAGPCDPGGSFAWLALLALVVAISVPDYGLPTWTSRRRRNVHPRPPSRADDEDLGIGYEG